MRPDAENRFGEANLVMEVAAGGGLFERLVSEGAYTEKLASKIMRQVARAVYHLHSRGIIHRDIKPSNVMLTIDNDVRIIDFGIAICADADISRIEGIAGSPSYMSPEQVEALTAYLKTL